MNKPDLLDVIKFTDILEARPVKTFYPIAGITFSEMMRGIK